MNIVVIQLAINSIIIISTKICISLVMESQLKKLNRMHSVHSQNERVVSQRQAGISVF